MARKRRGMIIKNVSESPVTIEMASRTLRLPPGNEQFLTSDEVLDSTLREHLQVRSVAVVRPATEEEEEAFRASQNSGASGGGG